MIILEFPKQTRRESRNLDGKLDEKKHIGSYTATSKNVKTEEKNPEYVGMKKEKRHK